MIDTNPFCLGIFKIMFKEWFNIQMDLATSDE